MTLGAMGLHVVARAAEIPPGRQKLVHASGRPIAVFNVGGEFFALANQCPHQGGSLCEGLRVGLVSSDEPGTYRVSRQGEFVRCPWHAWEFDLRTGRSRNDPDRVFAETYNVRTASGASLAAENATGGPLPADETFLVVEL